MIDDDCICNCSFGWEGNLCELKTPCSTRCLLGGNATGYLLDNDCSLCECPKGWEGDIC